MARLGAAEWCRSGLTSIGAPIPKPRTLGAGISPRLGDSTPACFKIPAVRRSGPAPVSAFGLHADALSAAARIKGELARAPFAHPGGCKPRSAMPPVPDPGGCTVAWPEALHREGRTTLC